jgi:hypothetical protein
LLVANEPLRTSFVHLDGGLLASSLSGWTTAGSPVWWLVGHSFHHPRGSWRRATPFGRAPMEDCHFFPGSLLCCDGLDDYMYLFHTPDAIVEPGSHGAGLFDDDGLFRAHFRRNCFDEYYCRSNALGEWSMFTRFSSVHGRMSFNRWLRMGDTMHVNHQHNPEFQFGFDELPFGTVAAANEDAWRGMRIQIEAGVYSENVLLNQPRTLVANGGSVFIGN